MNGIYALEAAQRLAHEHSVVALLIIGLTALLILGIITWLLQKKTSLVDFSFVRFIFGFGIIVICFGSYFFWNLWINMDYSNRIKSYIARQPTTYRTMSSTPLIKNK